jgi:hypothetical protein
MSVSADPSVGLGLNFTFGSNGLDAGVGVRVFSDDTKGKTVASLGLDYMLKSKGLRASVGATRLMDNSYVELNGGYNFKHQGFDLGLGGGFVDTKTQTTSAAIRTASCPFCGALVCGCALR